MMAISSKTIFATALAASAETVNAKRSLSVVDNERYKIARPGFEPGLNDSESFVLPLHHQAMFIGGAGI